MNKTHLIFLIPSIFLSQIMADTSPEYTEMMEAMDKLNKKQEVLFQRVQSKVEQVDEARSLSLLDGNKTQSIDSKIIEANAVGDIAESVAKVEIAKIQAKDTLLKEVKNVEMAKAEGNLSQEEVEKVEAKAVSTMAKSLVNVESSKLDAVETLAEATKKVEISKTEPAKTLVSPESALSVAKSVAAVKVAKAVSAVEITQAVSDVENSEVKEESLIYPRKSLAEVEAEARALIAQEVAKVEIAKANALANIARVVASVEIAKARESQIEEKALKSDLF